MSEVTIRPVRRDDKQRIGAAFKALHPWSIYLRFFCHKKELSEAELHRMTECDGTNQVALVATIGSGSREAVVAVGEYARNGAAAEVAFAVGEDFRQRGIATRLLRHLIAIARANGLARLEADVLPENRPMLTLLRHSGLPVSERCHEGVVHATLRLA